MNEHPQEVRLGGGSGPPALRGGPGCAWLRGQACPPGRVAPGSTPQSPHGESGRLLPSSPRARPGSRRPAPPPLGSSGGPLRAKGASSAALAPYPCKRSLRSLSCSKTFAEKVKTVVPFGLTGLGAHLRFPAVKTAVGVAEGGHGRGSVSRGGGSAQLRRGLGAAEGPRVFQVRRQSLMRASWDQPALESASCWNRCIRRSPRSRQEGPATPGAGQGGVHPLRAPSLPRREALTLGDTAEWPDMFRDSDLPPMCRPAGSHPHRGSGPRVLGLADPAERWDQRALSSSQVSAEVTLACVQRPVFKACS